MAREVMSPRGMELPNRMAMYREFCLLALNFPTIRFCPGAVKAAEYGDDGHACQELLRCLREWLATDIAESERQAALFILNLWAPAPELWPAFDLFKAMNAWDHEHHRAFAMWALRPWRP